jgi:DNA sulfur modification protein DndC
MNNGPRTLSPLPARGPPVAETRMTKGGLRAAVAPLLDEIRELYRADQSPWIIGYSGGKDSTAVLQLVWMALTELPVEQRAKPVYVISTDTQVENPVVAAWVDQSHATMAAAARTQRMPMVPTRLTPTVEDTFWVNLIGKGYPAPRPKFRWCTERLKIKPSNTFIEGLVQEHREAILVLGTRKAESAARARTMAKHEERQVSTIFEGAQGRTIERKTESRARDRLSPNGSLPGCQVYSPIEAWANDDVWMFLTQVPNAWGWSNHDLMGMYAGATEGGECPLVVDTSTPSCGDSRFGCWVCTLVDKDKSMAAMISNDAEKEWMLPLLEMRDLLDMRDDEGFRNDAARRDFRRINGNLTLETYPKADAKASRRRSQEVRERHEYYQRTGRVHVYDEKNHVISYLVHGPYTQPWREELLRRLLQAQQWVRANGPKHVRNLTLITDAELAKIREHWVLEKGEIEDSLPGIYRQVMGEEYPGPALDDHRPFGNDELRLLREASGYDPEKGLNDEAARLRYEGLRGLLDLEHEYRSMGRRAGLFDGMTKVIDAHAFADERDALTVAMNKARVEHSVEDRLEAVQAQSLFAQTFDPVLSGEDEIVEGKGEDTGRLGRVTA